MKSQLQELTVHGAVQRMREWISIHGIQVKDLCGVGEYPSVATINRFLDAKKGFESLDRWRRALFRLCGKLDRVAKASGVSDGFSLYQVFPEFSSLTSALPQSLLSNNPDLLESQMRDLAAPLIEHLQLKWSQEKARKNIYKASQLLAWLCDLLEWTSDYEGAAPLLSELASLNEATSDFHNVADALLRRGIVLFYSGKYPESRKTLLAGIKIVSDSKKKRKSSLHDTELRLNNYLALVEAETGDTNSALKILQNTCLPIARDNVSLRAEASVRYRIATIYHKRKEYQDARTEAICALRVRAQLSMRSEAARALSLLGRIYLGQEMHRQSVLALSIAFEIQDDLHDMRMRTLTEYDLGSAMAKAVLQMRIMKETQFAATFNELAFPDPSERTLLQSLTHRNVFDVICSRTSLAAKARAHLESVIRGLKHHDLTDSDKKMKGDAADQLAMMSERSF
jgi:tetratricopeptide (TPR) repeat protein